MTGEPTRPFPASYNVDVKEFMPVAKGAVSLVTKAMANQEWESLLGLVDPESSGKQTYREMTKVTVNQPGSQNPAMANN